jgi:hypothetical protein
MATLGIITCEVLELEFAYLLANDDELDTLTVVDTDYSKGFIQALEDNNGMKPRLIDYIGHCLPSLPGRLDVLVQILEIGLHTVIKKLQKGVTDAAVEMGPHVDAIVLGYGLCGNALINHDELLKDADVPIFMPIDDDHTVDDCVGLIIGGREKYYEEQCKVAGTFFMNAGFSRHWADLLHKAHGVGFDESISKRIMAGYERSLLLTTPVISRQEMADNIEQFNTTYGLRTESREGTLEILEKTWQKGKRYVMSKDATMG